VANDAQIGENIMDQILRNAIDQALELMQRVGNTKNWNDLSERDNKDSLELIKQIEKFIELQHESPARFKTYGVPDNIIEIFNFYIEWFNSLDNEEMDG
jgi:hypothetical protein